MIKHQIEHHNHQVLLFRNQYVQSKIYESMRMMLELLFTDKYIQES